VQLIEALQTLCRQATQFYLTTIAANAKKHLNVGAWQQAFRLLGPFDDAQFASAKFIAKTGFQKFFGRYHAVQIEVHRFYSLAAEAHCVRFHQRIGSNFDMPLMARRMQQRARERRLAHAKVAVQVERHAGTDDACERRAKRRRGGFVLEHRALDARRRCRSFSGN
jgi:hypothetical protein